MAGDPKKLIISAAVDVKEFTKLDKELARFKTRFNDLSKSVGKNFGDLTKEIGKNNALAALDKLVSKMKDLGVATENTADIARDQLSKAIDDERRSFEAMRREMELTERGVIRLKEHLRQLRSGGGSADDIRNAEQALGAKTQLAGNLRQNVFQKYDDMGGMGSGSAGASPTSAASMLGSSLGRALAPAIIGGLILKRVGDADKILDNMDLTPIRAEAATKGQLDSVTLQQRTGNFSNSLALRQIMEDPKKLQILEKLSDPNGGRRMFGAVAGGIKGVLSLSPDKFFDEIINSGGRNAIARLMEMMQAQQESNPLLQAATAMAVGAAPGRLGAIRSVGDAGRFGRLMGGGGDFTQDEKLGHIRALLGSGGRQALGNMHQYQQALRAGLDPATAAALAGGAAFGGSGDALATHFAALTSTGGMDILAANRAGMFVGNNMFTGMGRQNGLGVGAFMSGGDVYTERTREQGIGALGSVLSGFDSYQKTRNIVNAIGAAGADNVTGADALSRLDPVTAVNIIRGGPSSVPQYLTDLGVTYSQIQQYFRNTISSLGDRAPSGLFKSGSNAGKLSAAMQRGDVNIGDIPTMSLGEGLALGRKLGISNIFSAAESVVAGTTGGQFSPDQIHGMFGGLGALGTPLGTEGQVRNAGKGTPEQQIVEKIVQGELQQWQTVSENVRTILGALGTDFDKLSARIKAALAPRGGTSFDKDIADLDKPRHHKGKPASAPRTTMQHFL